MNTRVSSVDQINIVNISDTCILEVGDSKQIAPVTKAIAVQREQAIFFENEFHFKDYLIFGRSIPQPVIYERLEITTENESPVISVQQIAITTVSTSSVIQLGSSENIRCECRVKHIRHLLREK